VLEVAEPLVVLYDVQNDPRFGRPEKLEQFAIRSDPLGEFPQLDRRTAAHEVRQGFQQRVVEGLLVRFWKCAREQALKDAVTHHRPGIGQRRVVPLMASNPEEPSQVFQETGMRAVREKVGMSPRRESIDAPFEPANAPLDERVLPGRLRNDAQNFHRQGDASGQRRRRFRIGGLGSDELVEGRGKQFAARRRSEQGVDARQVVVHPRAVHADAAPQRLLHCLEAAA
jgi:hypothetical protein